MQLTQAQQATLKTWIAANAAALTDQQAANLANSLASPAYWVWRTGVSVADIYNLTDDTGVAWDWTNYQAQSVTQQGAWTQMGIVGQVVFMAQQNIRNGILAIYGNTGAGLANRQHCYAIGRRPATNFEKLYIAAVVSPPINTGNDNIAGNRGKTTNPDLLGLDAIGNVIEGNITPQLIAENR